MLLRSNSRFEVTKEPLQVVVRIRPLAGVAETGYAWYIERRADGQHWVCHKGPESKGSFAFDHCFDERTGNRQVFDATAKKLVQSPLSGSNATILAYGQTSSGKTHSILGTPYEPGMLPLAVEEIFGFEDGPQGGQHLGRAPAAVSYYEIFNEKVTDLLTTSPVGSASLPVKESAGQGFFVQGLREAPVYSNEDVLCLVARGEERRRYARTRWNDYSSRSHVIFTLSFAPRGEGQSKSKLNIVDLAGCENHKHEASEDGRHINRSLFFLGEVISKLCKDPQRLSWSVTRRSPSFLRKEPAGTSESRESRGVSSWSAGLRAASPSSRPRSPSRGRERSDFIPYRDSKLTRVLRSSLGGDARTLLLVTVHPSASFAEQSLTSLRFATKARSVDNYIPGQGYENLATSDAQRTIEALQEKLRRLEQPGRGIAPGVPEAYRRKLQDRRGDDALQKELEYLRLELREKERELANKARLLSERDRQLGHLREQLDMATRDGHRRHGPDAGGGLPLKADQWAVEGLPFAGSEEFTDSTSQAWPMTPPMTRVPSGSRAEDICCLRSPSSFVMRQQTPAEERGTPICETQEELVEKLVKMAAMQINTSKAQFASSSERSDVSEEVGGGAWKVTEAATRIPRRGCPPGPPRVSGQVSEGVSKNDMVSDSGL